MNKKTIALIILAAILVIACVVTVFFMDKETPQEQNDTLQEQQQEEETQEPTDEKEEDKDKDKEEIATDDNVVQEETNKPEETAKPQEPTTITVYVAIECKSILDASAHLKEDLVRKAGNGVILSRVAIEVPIGTNAMEATQLAAANKNVSIAGDSGYIKAISGIGEREATAMSGWKFSISGEFGGKGADEVVLEDGDSIFWGYTVDGSKAY